jgi:hypothetical protein
LKLKHPETKNKPADYFERQFTALKAQQEVLNVTFGMGGSLAKWIF